jgi:hypothetical protein
MSIYEQIIAVYPELTSEDFQTVIILQDDSDGLGAYIAKWQYSEPIPDGLSLGKPKTKTKLG